MCRARRAPVGKGGRRRAVCGRQSLVGIVERDSIGQVRITFQVGNSPAGTGTGTGDGGGDVSLFFVLE